jgi:hypothetical protein
MTQKSNQNGLARFKAQAFESHILDLIALKALIRPFVEAS